MLNEATLYPVVLWAALNLGLMLLLGLNVSRMRVKAGVGLGTGDDPKLERAIRAHGNNTEYVPGLLIGLGLLALLQFPAWFLHTVGGGLFVARILQAHGIQQITEGVPVTRAAGNLLTWLLYLVTVVALLYGIWF